MPWPSVFYILVPDWNLVPNHNRQNAASNASVNTHSPFLLVGDYTPNPTERRIHSAAAHFTHSLYSVNETCFHSDSKPFEGMDASLNAFLIVLAVSSPRFRAASITSWYFWILSVFIRIATAVPWKFVIRLQQ